MVLPTQKDRKDNSLKYAGKHDQHAKRNTTEVQSLGDFRVLFYFNFLEEIVYKLVFERFEYVQVGQGFQAEKMA